MTSRDEALRALEKEWRDTADQCEERGLEADSIGLTVAANKADARADELRGCADQLAAILSARQEVAPVAWPLASEGEKKIGWTLDYKFIESVEKRARELDYEEAPSLEGVELVLRAVADIYTSPAQTSEASDAVTEETAADRISEMLMDVADMHGRFPEAKADPIAWAHLVIYCDDISADLHRYAYLTGDLRTPAERRRRREILAQMSAWGKGATDAAIDAAMRQEGGQQ